MVKCSLELSVSDPNCLALNRRAGGSLLQCCKLRAGQVAGLTHANIRRVWIVLLIPSAIDEQHVGPVAEVRQRQPHGLRGLRRQLFLVEHLVDRIRSRTDRAVVPEERLHGTRIRPGNAVRVTQLCGSR